MSTYNYSLLTPGKFVDNLAVKKRLQMYQLFMQEFAPTDKDTVLDVGVTADKDALSSNYFEKYYPHKHKIIALSNQDAGFLETIYPGLCFKLGDACKLPFEDKSIDFIISSAVIEHIGRIQNQKKMLAECHRVARKGIFITTPNRWHPIELHTLLPLIHWLPKTWHRFILRLFGLKFYACEENLNLLDKPTITTMCKDIGMQQFKIRQILTLGFPSNLILITKM